MLGSGTGNTVRNAISHDGGQVVFSVPGADTGGDPLADCDVPLQLFVRRSDGTLTQISASRRTTPETALPALYAGAATDGSRIYFTSKERLIDSAPVDGGLYVFEPGSDTLRLAVAAADVQVLKVSDDGRSVAFQSGDAAFAAQVPGSDPGATGLYHYQEGPGGTTTIRFVGINSWGDIGGDSENGRSVDISPDGRTLALVSRGRLTGFDNTSATGNPAGEIFVWTADDGLKCASCDVAGQRPAGAQITGDARLPVGVNLVSPPGRSVTENGRVFFQTPDRLVAADTNGTQDVYEYAHGRVSLVSSGTADIKVDIIGAGTSGDSVMFVTPDSLVAGDVDGGNLDLYVARVNGGIPAQNDDVRSRPGCEGDACQAPPAARPSAATPGSALIVGAGNEPAPRASRSVAKVKVTAPKTARGTSFTVQVKAPAKGTIRIAGATIVTRTVKMAKAGTSRVTVKLSAKARRTLATQRRLTVRLSTRFTPSVGKAQTASATITIKSPAARARSSRSATASSFNAQNGEKS
jgi:hypothetical protein